MTRKDKDKLREIVALLEDEYGEMAEEWWRSRELTEIWNVAQGALQGLRNLSKR